MKFFDYGYGQKNHMLANFVNVVLQIDNYSYSIATEFAWGETLLVVNRGQVTGSNFKMGKALCSISINNDWQRKSSYLQKV